ncbi:MAG: hypothetical protein HY548_05640 [Elusimicrobia bacterium]|nr:hypothetical protein [Elusimicrobiota bacterium]
MGEPKNLERLLNIETSLDIQSAERELLQETQRQMRQRFAREKTRWEELFKQKEEMTASLKEEKARLEKETARIRHEFEELQSEYQNRLEFQSLEKTEREADLARHIRHYQSELAVYDQQLRGLEEARRQDTERYEKNLERWKEEEKAWYRFLEKKDGEIAELGTKLNTAELSRQQERMQREEDVRRFEGLRKEDLKKAEEERRTLQNSLETRKAENQNLQHILQKAREEIVDVTRRRDALEMELSASQETAGRLDHELKSLREAWEVERGHWRELWEHERASRETWYANMREWEDHLRKEREEWLRQFTSEQEARNQIAREVGRDLARTREVVWSLPLFAFLGRQQAAGPQRSAWRLHLPDVLLSKTSLGLGAGLAILLGVWGLLPTGPTSYQSPVVRPSGLAARNGQIWYVDWMNGQILQAGSRHPEKAAFHGAASPEFHPVAVSLVKDRLWSLDSWSRTVSEHLSSPPFTLLQSWPLEMAAPTALAWDGQGLWVLDQADQVLYRFSLGNLQAAERKVILPPGWRLSAIDFLNGEFWGFDEASKRLRRFSVSPAVALVADYRLPVHEKPEFPLTGLSATQKEIWTTSEKPGRVYRWSRRSLTFRSFWP